MIRMSVKGLAKYMISGPAAQRKVLRDFKYPREDEPMAMRLYYEDAGDCIETFLRSGYERQWLRAEGEALAVRAAGAEGRQRTRLQHNARAVRQYEQYFGGRQFQLRASLNLSIAFSGVQVKVVPDLNVIEGTRAKIIKLEFSLTPPSDALIAIIVQTMFEAATGKCQNCLHHPCSCSMYQGGLNGEGHGCGLGLCGRSRQPAKPSRQSGILLTHLDQEASGVEGSDRCPCQRLAACDYMVRTTATRTPDVLAIVLPHIPFTPGPEAHTATQRSKATDAYLAAHTVSVKEIEHLTGIDLLPKLDAESLKKAVASELWPRN